MKIIRMRIMEGPNYWSLERHRLVVVLLDLGRHAGMTRGEFKDLLEKLGADFPNLMERMSPAWARKRISVAALLGHLVAAVALEVQRSAGMAVEYGSVWNSGIKGECGLVFEYLVEDAGVDAAESAVLMIEHALSNKDLGLPALVARLRVIADGEDPGNTVVRNPPAGIFVIAVTGTNGKTTTSRVIAHLFHQAGRRVGLAITDGVFIDGRQVDEGDCAGPRSARKVLGDPGVEVAVLETARGGLLRKGLGYSACDVGIVTNVSEDHLGLGGIRNLDQMARLKAIAPGSVRPGGHAVLNADDDRVYQMRRRLAADVALFSVDARNPRIIGHLGRGGLCAYCEDGSFVLCHGAEKHHVIAVEDVPLTMGGKAGCMVRNVMPAILAAWLGGLEVADIAAGLRTIATSVSQTPGRLNVFPFNGFTALIDFAHNTAGFTALAEVVASMDGKPKVGIIAGLGDRRSIDNIEMGRIAAGMFDEIILRHDKDLRGGDKKRIEAMVLKGIAEVKPHMPTTLIADESEAIKHAIRSAAKGSLLVICCGEVRAALTLVTRLHNEAGCGTGQ